VKFFTDRQFPFIKNILEFMKNYPRFTLEEEVDVKEKG